MLKSTYLTTVYFLRRENQMRKLGLAIATLAAAAMTVTPVLAATELTVFNSKSEIQTQFEEEATAYSDAAGVDMTVTMSNDPVITHLNAKYDHGEPYALSMVDAKDIYTLREHALDLSDLEAAADTDYAIELDGKVLALPFCIEARGIIYNKSAIEENTGETFDPASVRTLDDFTGLLDRLVEGGMETPVCILKEDWSLAAHYLSQVYEERNDPEAFISDLLSGDADLIHDEKFNSLMDTFDVLKKYNYGQGEEAVNEDRNTTEDMLAYGDIAFMFGGNWDWSQINQFDYTENMGMMPVPQDTDDGTNDKLVGGGSKYFFIDNSSNTSDEQRQQAKDFLNWLVYEDDGQSFLVNDCALVPAFSNIDLPISDPLGASVSKYTNEGKLVANYNYLPDDHFAILGAMFQKYLAGISDRKGFAKDVETYWHTKTLTSHSE
jgi:raffinose/stachyose/melibiose transport system substrate-binding protein